MEQRIVGGAVAVSLIGVGCNNFGTRLDQQQATAVVAVALDQGMTHFDTAAMYGNGRSEEILGNALGRRRGDAVIATKSLQRPAEAGFRPGDLARTIRDSCEASLRRLGTDYIDIFYQHFPDPEAPMNEAITALSSLQQAGKVRCVACSNYSGEQLREVVSIARAAALNDLAANQIEWNLLHRDAEAEAVPAARELDVSIVPYYPLASGLLTGKYHAGESFPPGTRLAVAPFFADVATPDNFGYIRELECYAAERGHSLLELALAWLAAQPEVPTVIAGAMSPTQVRANAAAASWVLTADDLAALPSRH